jgi:hypothetical protein
MELNLDRVRADVRQASTEDLLDRATVYREGMELEALTIIDRELHERGISSAERDAHEERRRRRMLTGPEGLPVKCCRCYRPAVVEHWNWHRLWNVLPLFPRRFSYCREHAPDEETEGSAPDAAARG